MTAHPITEKAWGTEALIANRAFCGKVMTLRKGFRCSLHYHCVKDETFLVTRGSMLVEIGPVGQAETDPRLVLTEVLLTVGQSIDVPPLTLHRFTGLDHAAFVEFSTHDEPDDSYRLEPSGPVPR